MCFLLLKHLWKGWTYFPTLESTAFAPENRGKCSLLTAFEEIHRNFRMFLVISSMSNNIYGITDVIIISIELRFKTCAGSNSSLDQTVARRWTLTCSRLIYSDAHWLTNQWCQCSRRCLIGSNWSQLPFCHPQCNTSPSVQTCTHARVHKQQNEGNENPMQSLMTFTVQWCLHLTANRVQMMRCKQALNFQISCLLNPLSTAVLQPNHSKWYYHNSFSPSWLLIEYMTIYRSEEERKLVQIWENKGENLQRPEDSDNIFTAP